MAYELKTECPVTGCHGTLTYITYSSTMVAYHSPEGHDHDDNCKHHKYECSNGHVAYDRRQNVCPNPDCEWKGRTYCFCSILGMVVFEDKDEEQIIWREDEHQTV